MAQSPIAPINPTTTSGTTLATLLNNWSDAVHSSHKGDSPPSYAEAGMIWCDDNATPWAMKVYDGTDWIIIGYVDTSANVWLISDEAVFADPADLTKRFRIDVGNVGGGNTRVLTLPNQNVTISAAGAALIDDADAGAQRTTLGATSVGNGLFTAASASAARGTLGGSTIGQAIFTAANVAAAQAAAGQIIRVKASDQTFTSSTWSDVTDLSFPVGAGETWAFEFEAFVNFSNNASTAEFGFNGPAFSAFEFRRARLVSGTSPSAGSVGLPSAPITAYDDGVNAALQDQETINLGRGLVTFSSAGTFTARARRAATNGTATVRSSSILRGWRLS